MNDGGATRPKPASAAAPRAVAMIGPSGLGFGCGFGGPAAGAGLGGGACGLGAGGGQVIWPSLTTVAPRTTSSLKSIVMTPSFFGVMSESRCLRFVAYNWLDCVGSRLGRST